MNMPMMPGMLTPKQMDALRKATGPEFDHLFLTGMIQHHTGALTMVKDLFDTPARPGPAVIRLHRGYRASPSRVRSTRCKTCWPRRNNRNAHQLTVCASRRPAVRSPLPLSVTLPFTHRSSAGPAKPTVYNNPQLPNDPRVGLKGGITDAGVAAFGMELVVNLPKPAGFAAGTTPQDAAPRRRQPPPPAAPGAPPRGLHAPAIVRLHQLRSGLQRQPCLRRQL